MYSPLSFKLKIEFPAWKARTLLPRLSRPLKVIIIIFLYNLLDTIFSNYYIMN